MKIGFIILFYKRWKLGFGRKLLRIQKTANNLVRTYIKVDEVLICYCLKTENIIQVAKLCYAVIKKKKTKQLFW